MLRLSRRGLLPSSCFPSKTRSFFQSLFASQLLHDLVKVITLCWNQQHQQQQQSSSLQQSREEEVFSHFDVNSSTPLSVWYSPGAYLLACIAQLRNNNNNINSTKNSSSSSRSLPLASSSSSLCFYSSSISTSSSSSVFLLMNASLFLLSSFFFVPPSLSSTSSASSSSSSFAPSFSPSSSQSSCSSCSSCSSSSSCSCSSCSSCSCALVFSPHALSFFPLPFLPLLSSLSLPRSLPLLLFLLHRLRHLLILPLLSSAAVCWMNRSFLFFIFIISFLWPSSRLFHLLPLFPHRVHSSPFFCLICFACLRFLSPLPLPLLLPLLRQLLLFYPCGFLLPLIVSLCSPHCG